MWLSCRTVQCGCPAVQCGCPAVPYSVAVLYNAVQCCRTLPYHAVLPSLPYRAVLPSLPYRTVLFGVLSRTVPFGVLSRTVPLVYLVGPYPLVYLVGPYPLVYPSVPAPWCTPACLPRGVPSWLTVVYPVLPCFTLFYPIYRVLPCFTRGVQTVGSMVGVCTVEYSLATFEQTGAKASLFALSFTVLGSSASLGRSANMGQYGHMGIPGGYPWCTPL